jgi:hypothetical protein
MDRSTVNLLMGIYARAGDIKKTESLAKVMQMHEIGANRSTLAALVTASKVGGDIQRANTWLTRMQHLGFEPGDLDTPTDTPIYSSQTPSSSNVDSQDDGSRWLKDVQEEDSEEHSAASGTEAMAGEMEKPPAAGLHHYSRDGDLDDPSYLSGPAPPRRDAGFRLGDEVHGFTLTSGGAQFVGNQKIYFQSGDLGSLQQFMGGKRYQRWISHHQRAPKLRDERLAKIPQPQKPLSAIISSYDLPFDSENSVLF